jgi:hypothetical protein
MEVARLAAERLAAGDAPPEYGLDVAEAQRLGSLARKWRNYLALGALGPDLFYLLPDFKTFGGAILSAEEWIVGIWDTVDRALIGPWEKWMGPVGANDADLAAQLTGGLSTQLAMALDDVSRILNNAIATLPTRALDIFGLLSSGPAQGVPETGFYWSDMFHYRRTYEVPRVMLQLGRDAELRATTDEARADGEAQQAFALGWLSHCGADVTGHAFTSAKTGGPYRLHWQRHHLLENHFDSFAYDGRYGGDAYYNTIGTSALHFRVAFRQRDDAPYNGRKDAPAYDYFAGFPAYSLGHAAIDDLRRRRHFDMDSGDLPDHLVQLLSDTLAEVYGNRSGDPAKPPDITPKILLDAPEFSDDGRPNDRALDVMWTNVYAFLKMTGTGGLTLIPPEPPPLLNEHPFPTPPGGTTPEDEARGADVDDDDDFTIVDLFLALISWLIFIGQVVIWLVTVLPGLIVDVATFPAREVLYYSVIAPLFSVVMASRRLLVLTGFLMPDTSEIDNGLTTLGHSSTFLRRALLADLAVDTGYASAPSGVDEPTGRIRGTDEWVADPAYPRDTPRDPVPVLSQLLTVMGSSAALPHISLCAVPGPAGDPYSEWVFPWRYPDQDVQGHRLGWEADLIHAGPFVLGEDAATLLARGQTDVQVARDYETATSPEATEQLSKQYLRQNRHLGRPVDYTLYLLGRMSAGDQVPSFNLDSDRGYAWRCWDWVRHTPELDSSGADLWTSRPFTKPFSASARYECQQPCTPPAQFDPYWVGHQPGCPHNPLAIHSFDQLERRRVQYLDQKSRDGDCGATGITSQDRERAEMPPEGEG